jgi:peroxin-19
MALPRQFETMGGDPGLANALDSFLSNLLSKDVLYEPLQQISMRYPSYLAAAREQGLAAEELERYTRQAALVAELLAVFDRSPQEAERIMQLMQDMQKCGAPPPSIMRDIAPDLRLGADGMPEMPTPADLAELQHAGGAELASMCAQQ